VKGLEVYVVHGGDQRQARAICLASWLVRYGTETRVLEHLEPLITRPEPGRYWRQEQSAEEARENMARVLKGWLESRP
jgi:hypothetical protein